MNFLIFLLAHLNNLIILYKFAHIIMKEKEKNIYFTEYIISSII